MYEADFRGVQPMDSAALLIRDNMCVCVGLVSFLCGRWMCHFDDDTYVNIPELVELLRQHKHTEDWYLGKPSLRHPMEISDVDHPGVSIFTYMCFHGHKSNPSTIEM